MARIDTLKEIIAKKKERVFAAKQALPEEELKIRCQGLPPCRPLREAISKPRQISLIAEIKRSSPSRGVIRQDFDLHQIARAYQEAGVQALSVLTEEDYFGGSLGYLADVRSLTTVPLLRKDFILEPYQVYESKAFGADAILLIADILTQDQITEFSAIAAALGLTPLVEVHTERELKKVLKLKCVELIGINNRDLHTLAVDFKTTETLFPLIPKGKVVVVESGIKNYQDVLFLKILGASAVLVGEAFMDAPDIKKKVEELMGW